MQAKLLGHELKQRNLKPETLPTILKQKGFRIVNINCETADRIRYCKRIQTKSH